MKLTHLPALILTAVLLASCGGSSNTARENVAENKKEDLMEKAREIHQRVIALDTHCDISTSNFTTEKNYTQDLPTQVTLPKMEHGGLDVAWFIVYTGQEETTEEAYAAAYENAMDKFRAIHRLCEEIAPDRIELATSSADVERIISEGKKAAMIGIENAFPVAEDLSRIQEFYDLGGRYMSLAHNGHNQFSDSHTGEKDSVWRHNGISELGMRAIEEMNRVGIIIDISHPSKESMRQTIELSKAPVIASHSAARALSNESRNLDDEQLKWVKDNGGVIQTVGLGTFVNTEKKAAFEADSVNNEPVSVSDFVDHIDYMVNLIGIEHVGISSDFDGGGGIEGWNDASETFNVTLELVRRGYSEEEISKIWSGNLLRVLDEVQAVANKIQKGEL